MQRKIKCIETNQIYNSVSEAGRALNIDKGAISRCCNGQQKQAKGYRFEFVNDRNDAKNNNNNNVVQQLKNIQGKVNIIYSLLTKDNENNKNVDITEQQQEAFKNVLTQPTLDLLSLTNMELINALAGDILAYRNRVKTAMRKMAGQTNNQPHHQEKEMGWDDIEHEERRENNPVIEEVKEEIKQEEPANNSIIEEPKEEIKQEEPAKNPVMVEEPQQEQQQQEPKKLYKTIDPATLSEEEKECRRRAGVPLDIDLGDVDDGWDDCDIDDSLVVMR